MFESDHGEGLGESWRQNNNQSNKAYTNIQKASFYKLPLICESLPPQPTYYPCCNNLSIIIMHKGEIEITYAVVARQAYAIFVKNIQNSLTNKKKLFGELILPLIISAIYVVTQTTKKSNPLISILLDLLLKIYIGLIGTSALRELITLFITERIQHFRQYQMIFGVSFRTHTLSNLFYMGAYQSFFLLPFYITLNYYQIDILYILYFGAFVISSCTLTLALTSFFRDHKIALEIIGMLFSLGAFLPFAYDENADTWLNFLIMVIPNSSFTIAVLNKKTECALISLAFVKVYLLVYSICQFPQYYGDLIMSCCRRIGHYIPAFDRQPTNLMEQFELNEVVNSQLQQYSVHRNVVIKTQGLIKTYKVKDTKINALNGINLKICESQIIGLLGRNGAGKTSLVDILTGVTKPTQGSFQIATNTSIGICYQHEVLYDVLTVQQHLQFYSRIKVYKLPQGVTRKAHIDDIIRTLQIEGERTKKVKELSGGNKRKLSIAIAIIGRPQILIFDQPTSGLDPLSRMYVWDIFQQLRRMRSTIILTTHHLDQAQKLTDWICVIEKGSIIVQNTAAQIKQKYGKGFHLQIYHQNSSSSFQAADIDKYKSMVQKCKLKALQLEHIPSQINFLIKPILKQTSAFDFQTSFIQLISDLQKDSLVQVRFHSNTLQESFIAILRDEQNNSGDSLGEQIMTIRQKHNLNEVGFLWCKQVVGVVIKNFLFQKSIFLQSIIIYNINILIILISKFFNNFFREHLNTNTTTDQQYPATTNPMIILQGYTIMATAFITAIVYEKQKKIVGVLNTRGLGWVAYWLGSFIFDYSVFLVNLLIIGNFIAVKEVQFLGWVSIGKLGLGIILYTYCASHLFEKVKSASAWFSIINMVLSLIIMPMILFGSNTVFSNLDFIKYLYPYYDLTVAVFFEQNGAALKEISELSGLKRPTESVIHITILIYLAILIWIQLRPLARIKQHFKERDFSLRIDQKIRLENVSKSFGSIQALKDVSYYANEERLALLGHNGAGKSTTFGLLSAQLTANSGQIYLQNYLRPPWQNRLNSAGICYQQDALWEGMLVEQILTIFSWIVPISNKERQTQWLYQNLQFDTNNSFKRFSNLSGGNKRKLCMMIALYGDPSLRLLDQCSTGLDPSSRLAMVETIKYSKRGTTIFTTHSMSEAQDLCTKTVIMSKGRTLQFQLISRLRSKYFTCCWVQLEIDQSAADKLNSDFARPGISFSGEGKHVKLQVDKKTIKKSQLMQQLLLSKRKGYINNFSWIEPRLEDVYIKVTRENGDNAETDHQPNIDVI